MKESPIFIIGSGRSGTTLLYELLCKHEKLAWASNFTNRMPTIPHAVFLSRFSLLRQFRLFKPAHETIEGYRYCGIDSFRFPITSSELLEDTNSEKLEFSKRRMSKYFSVHCKAFGRDRFLSKNTANSMRIDLLNLLFPDAKFIHIHRNPYGVISSLLHVRFWPNLNLWWSDSTPSELESRGVDKYLVAGTHWAKQLESICRSSESVQSGCFLNISYEDLVTDTNGSMEKIVDFCELGFSSAFRSEIDGAAVSRGSLDKWKQNGDAELFAAANPAIEEMASRLGYKLLE